MGCTDLLEGVSFAGEVEGEAVGVLVPPHPLGHRPPVGVQEPQPLQHVSMPCPAPHSPQVRPYR